MTNAAASPTRRVATGLALAVVAAMALVALVAPRGTRPEPGDEQVAVVAPAPTTTVPVATTTTAPLAPPPTEPPAPAPSPSSAPHQGPNSDSVAAGAGGVAANPVLERIVWSMAGPHEAQPHGVPASWDWAQQPKVDNALPPAGMAAVTGWGQIYLDAAGVAPTNVRVQLRDMVTYAYLRSSGWVTLQRSGGVEGGWYAEDFSGNSSVPADVRSEASGGVSTSMSPGYSFHFWPTGGRAALADPSDVAAVVVTVQARLITDDPSGPDGRGMAGIIANVGGDWWRSIGSGFGDGSNNPGIGQGRFSYLSAAWSTIAFYTGGPYATAPGAWSEADLRAAPPPG